MTTSYASHASIFVAAVSLALCAPALADDPTHDAFTYQGQLRESGEPVAGPVNFAFRLYDADLGGVQVGPEIEAFAFDGFDDDGRFTLDLAFGKGVFDGTPLWVEVRVNGGVLSPRQPIMPTPYSIRALDVAAVADGAFGGTYSQAVTLSNPGNQFLGTFAGSGAGLTGLNASNIATGTLGGSLLGGNYTNVVSFSNAGNTFSGSGSGLLNLNASNISSGTLNDARLSLNVARRNLQNTFTEDNHFSGKVGIGLYPPSSRQFQVFSSDLTTAYFGNESETGGIALDALAIGLTNSIAIRGETHGADGTAIWAWATNFNGQPKALFAWCDAPDGHAGYFIGGRNYFSGRIGVGTDAPTAMVHAVTNSAQYALLGEQTAGSGVTYGVRGQSASSSGYGVFGQATASTGLTRGVYGLSNSTGGTGVTGWASATTGTTAGVVGQSDSTSGRGVFGYVAAATGATNGVFGQSASGSGTGVYAYASSNTGTTYGLRAEVNSPNGYSAVFFGPAGSRTYFQRSVGIGTLSPGFLLHVNGDAGKPGGGSWSTASDARLKHNVQPLPPALDRLLALQGVTFEYRDHEAIHELPGQRIGMIAQEVAQVFPDWVDEADDGYLRLTYRGFEAVIVEALRELREEKDAEIQMLRHEREADIAALRDEKDAELSLLRDEVAQLRAIVGELLQQKEMHR
jgi:hypothetical protein